MSRVTRVLDEFSALRGPLLDRSATRGDARIDAAADALWDPLRVRS